MEYIAQIFTGSWHSPACSPKAVMEKLQKILEQVNLKAVIMGWNLNGSLCASVGKLLREKGIRFYLWLPVFSEIGNAVPMEPAVNLFGQSGTFHFGTGEFYQYYCPTSPENLRAVVSLYDTSFSDCGFDGVFLDKVRGPSFIAGAEDVFGCCCVRCRSHLAKRGASSRVLSDFIKEYGLPRALSLRSFDPQQGFTFLSDEVERFFDARTEIYTENILLLTEMFRKKGLSVGLSLFPPCLSRLVGQDTPVLCDAADFISPMLYRRTDGSGGCTYELQAFRNAAAKNIAAYNMLNSIPIAEDDFIRQQMDVFTPEQKKKVFPGVELTFHKMTARTDPAYVSGSLRLLSRCGLHTAVLAWDLMQAPKENLAAAARIQAEHSGEHRHTAAGEEKE